MMLPFPILARASALAFVTFTALPRCTTRTLSTVLQASAAGGGGSGPPVPQSPLTQYIVRYTYIPDVLERRGPHRERHLQLARQWCLSGGPTAPARTITTTSTTTTPAVVPTGALFVFADAAAAAAFVAADPYVSEGIVAAHTVEDWTVVIQN